MELSQEIKCNILEFFDSSMDSVRYVSCDSGVMKQIPSFVSSDCTVVDFMRPSVYYTPMSPFLSLLRQKSADLSLVDEYAYSLQKNTFSSYLSTGLCDVRKDAIITSEISYEHKRCLRAIYEIFSHSVTTPIVILNAQFMDKDSFELVRMLEDSHRCKVLLCLDLTGREMTTSEATFFSELSSKQNYYEVVRHDIHESKDMAVAIEEKNFFTYENIFSFFVNCKNFLSLGNSVSYARRFMQEKSAFSFTDEQMEKIFLEIAQILFYAGYYDDAEVALNAVVESDNEELKDTSYLFMARVLYAKTAYFDSYQYVKRLLDTKHLEHRTYETYLAERYRCMILKKSINDTSDDAVYESETAGGFVDGNSLESFEIFFSLTLDSLANAEYDFTNNYISTILLVPYEELDGSSEKSAQYIKMIDEGANIAESINNEFAYSAIAHLKGDFFARVGQMEEAIEFYNKADSIRRKLDDGQSSVHIRNCIAYNSILQGDYIQAFKILHGVSDQILSLEDSNEIINTLSTVAKIYLLIGYYAECRRLLNSITKILKVYNLQSSKTFSVNDVNALQALIDIYYGKYPHAHLMCRNIKLNGIGYSPFSNVILLVLSSLFALHNQDLEKSKTLFNIAEKTLNETMPESKYLLVYINYLYAYFLFRAEEDALSDEYRKKTDEMVQEYNLTFYIEQYKEIPTRRIYTLDFFLPHFLVSLEGLERQSTKNQILFTLQKRIRDSLFLNKLMEFAGAVDSREDYIKVAVNEISDYMLCKAIYFAEVDETSDDWVTTHSIVRNSKYEPKSEDWKYLMIKTSDRKMNFVTIEGQKNIWYYNLSKYESTAALIIELDDNRNYSNEDLNILKIGLSNMQSQLTIISQREHLQRLSSIDQLSKLNNRRALEEKLDSESELIRRYENKENVKYITSITFIDLDHFKFYNDTYGHEAGDVMIESFAKLLRRIYRKVDFVSRFGGDEFVILLPGTSSVEAFRATERLREGLVEENYFIPALEKVLHRDMHDIPKEQYISFSAGICANVEIEEFSNMSLVKNAADKALYEAKETGRCRTILYTDLSDEKKQIVPR